jgi:hypothetical protein
MNTIFVSLLMTAALLAPAAAPDNTEIKGTWSGNWTPKGGIPDAITVELRQDDAGKLSGKFLTPTPMEFSKITFNRATQTLMFEATDAKSGKLYKLEGKIKGTELIGTLAANDTTGEIRLIKWTFFGR